MGHLPEKWDGTVERQPTSKLVWGSGLPRIMPILAEFRGAIMFSGLTINILQNLVFLGAQDSPGELDVLRVEVDPPEIAVVLAKVGIDRLQPPRAVRREIKEKDRMVRSMPQMFESHHPSLIIERPAHAIVKLHHRMLPSPALKE